MFIGSDSHLVRALEERNVAGSMIPFIHFAPKGAKVILGRRLAINISLLRSKNSCKNLLESGLLSLLVDPEGQFAQPNAE